MFFDLLETNRKNIGIYFIVLSVLLLYYERSMVYFLLYLLPAIYYLNTKKAETTKYSEKALKLEKISLYIFGLLYLIIFILKTFFYDSIRESIGVAAIGFLIQIVAIVIHIVALGYLVADRRSKK